jgi:DHA1 family multidrug resistance protein-like MFS transporter
VVVRGALGILSSIMDIGHSSGPMVTGVLIGAYSFRMAFGMVGVGLVVASLIFGFMMRWVIHRTETRTTVDT